MIKRSLYQKLKDHLPKKEITIITGPRQAGKTTLMKLLMEELKRNGERTVFFNLDIEADKVLFNSQESLIKRVELEIGNQKGYVFIDEIQRKENAGLFLKGIYDMSLPYKFIVSGSGSLELKEKIHESLAGRKLIFELSTINFLEFVNYKTEYKYEDRLEDFFKIELIKSRSLLTEYLTFGGYPRVLQSPTLEEKKEILGDLYQSFLEKDIKLLLGIDKTENFSYLVRILASQVGNLVNVSEISSTVGISSVTVKNYLWYLEKTFIVRKITPFFRNIRKELTRNPITYFNDLGLRNFSTGDLINATSSPTAGFLFQNFVYNLLREQVQNPVSQVHFWRTTDKAEVDFVIDKGQEIVPVEVKYQSLKKPEISRSFRNFIEKYQPNRSYLVNLDYEGEKKIGKTVVYFIPVTTFASGKFI